mmetsp:Transcript_10510/g.23656  ORF Transcript_10510/g.23656 Transcript_10510/m.23656 type:complete len:487 (-) Transcript_10510:46-1506(-)
MLGLSPRIGLPTVAATALRGLQRRLQGNACSGASFVCCQNEADHPHIARCLCDEETGFDGSGYSTPDQDADLAKFATRRPTPLSLQEVLAMTQPKQAFDIIKTELPIRLANRIAQLDTLPHLGEITTLRCARARIARSFIEVREATKAGLPMAVFAETVQDMKLRHRYQVKRIVHGLQEWRKLKLAEGAPIEEVIADIDKFLDHFFLSRISIEMLNSQFLGLFSDQVGIVDRDLDVIETCKQAVATVTRAAKKELWIVPPVEISFHGAEGTRSLPLVPTYLFYILVELLKNSFRAVAESHELRRDASDEPHPVVIRVSSDEAQVVLDIFDRGGGIPFAHQPHIWSYAFSSKMTHAGSLAEGPTPLSGFGVGLPLSRLYAEYIGGSLHLMSMPNFGTHAFLLLQRCSQRREGLPTYVNWLRQRQLREELLDLEARKRAAAGEEDYAEALRLKSLANEARSTLSQLESWGGSSRSSRGGANWTAERWS